jgi:hypothetical protein
MYMWLVTLHDLWGTVQQKRWIFDIDTCRLLLLMLLLVAYLSVAAAAAAAAAAATAAAAAAASAAVAALTKHHFCAPHSSLHHLLSLFLIFWLQHIYHCCQMHQLIAAPHSRHQGVGICHITADDV